MCETLQPHACMREAAAPCTCICNACGMHAACMRHACGMHVHACACAMHVRACAMHVRACACACACACVMCSACACARHHRRALGGLRPCALPPSPGGALAAPLARYDAMCYYPTTALLYCGRTTGEVQCHVSLPYYSTTLLLHYSTVAAPLARYSLPLLPLPPPPPSPPLSPCCHSHPSPYATHGSSPGLADP